MGFSCECMLCCKVFSGHCGRALYWHMVKDHGLDRDDAYSAVGQSLSNTPDKHETFEQYGRRIGK